MGTKRHIPLGAGDYCLHEARQRYDAALQDVYDPAYHYKSLQKAKVLAWERFQADQRHLTSLIGQERDAAVREALVLCKEIEYIEYKELVECQEAQLFAVQSGDETAWARNFPNRWNGQSAPLRARLRELCEAAWGAAELADDDRQGDAPSFAETRDIPVPEAVRQASRLFGLIPLASEDAIKKRFRELVKKYHPDTAQGSSTSASMFIEVRKAYEVLSRWRRK